MFGPIEGYQLFYSAGAISVSWCHQCKTGAISMNAIKAIRCALYAQKGKIRPIATSNFGNINSVHIQNSHCRALVRKKACYPSSIINQLQLAS